jgi:uncharacterized damage-inducible protein DinB
MKAQLLATLENSKQYTLNVAGMMPAYDFHFKPTDAAWNFGELLHHIAYGIQWWGANYVQGKETAWAPPAMKDNKQEILAYLEDAYRSLNNTLNNGPLSNDAVKGFHATIDHITHHRGQAVLYLRCKGITPPEYMY